MRIITLAKRLQQVKPSATLSLAARVTQLKAAGHPIINLTIGEPDFDTPEPIKEAARRALTEGFTKYTAVDGIPSLKEAIIKKFASENQLNYEPAQIIVSTGSKQAIYNLAQALLNPGDEVIIPAPYWVSYPEIMLLAEAIPVTIPTNLAQQFKITPEQLEAAITPRTRLLLLNSPSNPSGLAYRKQELAALGEVLLRHPEIIIATDDMYEHILWSKEPFANIVNACPELYERTVVFNGVSKAYAMTGWRIGYAAGPKVLIRAMANIQSQSTSNPNSIAQVAAQAALSGDQSCVREMARAYHHRHQIIAESFSKISGIDYLPADGTFYSFPCIEKLLTQHSTLKSDLDVAEHLLNTVHIAVMPGTPFGSPGHLRISFATSTELLIQAMEQLQHYFSKWN